LLFFYLFDFADRYVGKKIELERVRVGKKYGEENNNAKLIKSLVEWTLVKTCKYIIYLDIDT